MSSSPFDSSSDAALHDLDSSSVVKSCYLRNQSFNLSFWCFIVSWVFSECIHFETEIIQILRILCQKDIFYREQEVTRSKIYSNHGTGQLLNLKNLNLAARKCGRCGRRWLCHCEESLIGGRRRGKKRESGTTKTDHNVTNCTEKNIFLFLNCPPTLFLSCCFWTSWRRHFLSTAFPPFLPSG